MPDYTHGATLFPFNFSAVPVEEADDCGRDDAGSSSSAYADDVTSAQAYRLYVSHSLSMWNSRMYEFAVILFIQAAFPSNLVASSINGIAETVCVLFFSGALGRWVDRTPSRLRALILTIVINRITVLVSCISWFLILSISSPAPKHVFFAVALILGMVEKLSRSTNILSMERDWIPTLANPTLNTATTTPYDLTHLNTVMRRIDMLCKLIAPLAVSTFIFVVGSERIAVAVVASISMMSWGVECWCVRQVWNQNSRLRTPKEPVDDSTNIEPDNRINERMDGYTKASNIPLHPSFFRKFILVTKAAVREHMEGLQYYFGTPVWIPSVCAAIPHASVLTFSGTMITYLLNAGFSLNLVTVARASGAVFELGSTFLFPWAVSVLSRNGNTVRWYGMGGYQNVEAQDWSSRTENWQDQREEQATESKPISSDMEQEAIKSVGWWAIICLFLSLVCNPRLFTLLEAIRINPPSKIPALLALFYLDFTLSATTTTAPEHSISLVPTILVIACISLSLLFRWTYDLSATQLTQILVPASHRSSFGGTEMALVSVISLMHWISAAVWHSQRDFRWLATGSLVMVGGAVGGYSVWYKGGRPMRRSDTRENEAE